MALQSFPRRGYITSALNCTNSNLPIVLMNTYVNFNIDLIADTQNSFISNRQLYHSFLDFIMHRETLNIYLVNTPRVSAVTWAAAAVLMLILEKSTFTHISSLASPDFLPVYSRSFLPRTQPR